MKKLKVGLITYTVSFGGVGTFLISLGEKLQKKGHEVVVVSTDKKGVWFDVLKTSGLKSIHIDFGIWGYVPLGRVFHALRVGKLLRKKQFDLLIINHSFFAQVSAGFYKPPAKTISVIHNQLPAVVRGGCLNHEAMNEVVAVGPKVYEEVLKVVPAEKCSMILNGVKVPVEPSRVEHSKPLKILFVGRFEDKQKGIFLLPDILRKLVNEKMEVSFTLVGDGPDRHALMEMFQVREVTAFVTYKGLLSSEEVYQLYAGHHVLLLPSNFEGLPLTLMEAMGAGCVPIASLLPGSTDVCVVDGINGYLAAPNSVEGFFEKVKKLYWDAGKWKSMSTESIETARQQFSLDVMVEKYLKLFDEVLMKKEQCSVPLIHLGADGWKEVVPYYFTMWVKKYISLLKKKN